MSTIAQSICNVLLRLGTILGANRNIGNHFDTKLFEFSLFLLVNGLRDHEDVKKGCL